MARVSVGGGGDGLSFQPGIAQVAWVIGGDIRSIGGVGRVSTGGGGVVGGTELHRPGGGAHGVHCVRGGR